MMNSSDKKWTASDFQTWRKENAAEIEAARVKNQQAVDDLVIPRVMGALKRGFTFEAACDGVMRHPHCGHRNGVYITEETVSHSLRSIGWLPKAERKKGG